MRKTIFLPNCKIGSQELSRTQDIMMDNVRNIIEPIYDNVGLLIKRNLQGVLNNDWLVSIVNTGSIKVNKGKAFILDSNNELTSIELKADTIINTPEIDGIYKVLIRHTYSNFEQGTISISNNSNLVNGINTEFSKIFAINRRIIIDGQALVITNVISDTQLTISGNYGGVDIVNANFSVGGYFGEYPLNMEDNYIYRNNYLSLILTKNPKLENDILLAELTITNGWVISITDKREQIHSIHQEYPQLNHNQLRERRETIWRPSSLCTQNLNDEVSSSITPQILVNDLHVGTFRTKFVLGFTKKRDDKKVTLKFKPTYTISGMELITVDKVKYQVRLDIEGQPTGTAHYLDVQELSYDIENLADGYYELSFKVSKASTAFDLSIKLNEVYLTGGYNFIVE